MFNKNQVKPLKLENRLQITKGFHGGLHSSMRRTLMVARYMGVLPLCGLHNPQSIQLRFTLRSPYSVIYITGLLGQTMMMIMSLYLLCETSLTLPNFTNALFYVSNLCSSLMLAFLGRSWPHFIRRVEVIENKLPPFMTNLSMYCDLTMIFLLVATLVEHCFSVSYAVTVASSCNSMDVVKTYFLYNVPWIFNYTPFTLWKGLICEMFNIQSTFMWSYSDLLIMQMGIYLAEHFKTHNALLKENLKQPNHSCDDLRSHYLSIVKLVQLANKLIGFYILTSFGGNLYFICMQLFNSLNKSTTGHIVGCQLKNAEHMLLRGLEHTIYFTYSFTFLIMRTLLVLFLAARVNSLSMVPLAMLYEVPSSKFNLEVMRFIDQINNLKVGLSGLDFFYVTKSMILTLFGTVLTYELVLLQFNN
nr:gustatory receptor 8 [Achelura yunnanensis]